MGNLTNEQIEQKKQQFLRPCGSKRAELERKQLTEKVKQLKDELVEAGTWSLEDKDLDSVSGGVQAGSILKGGAGEFWDSRKPTTPEKPKAKPYL